MQLPRYVLAVVAAIFVSCLALVGSGRQAVHSATLRQAVAPTAPHHYIATVGYGQDDWAANIYSPHAMNIYVGDTVTWVNRGRLEPHTVTFGSMSRLRFLSQNRVLVTPKQNGPPELALNPALALATRRAQYDGSGFANSGFLRQGQRWTITFTRAGTYRYYCLLHFPGMFGVVMVRPRPAASQNYSVRTGYGSNTSGADVYFPDDLTVHVGSTVTWYGAVFHTISFAPAAVIAALRPQLIVPVPHKGGPPKLTLNPKIALASGGNIENGSGLYINSGILQPQHNTFSVTFTKPGVYHYACLVHFGMDGVIRVLP